MRDDEKRTQVFLVLLAREIETALKKQFEVEVDFAVVLFHKDDGTSANFIANTNSRAEVIKAFRVSADRLEAMPEVPRIQIDGGSLVIDPNSHN